MFRRPTRSRTPSPAAAGRRRGPSSGRMSRIETTGTKPRPLRRALKFQKLSTASSLPRSTSSFSSGGAPNCTSASSFSSRLGGLARIGLQQDPALVAGAAGDADAAARRGRRRDRMPLAGSAITAPTERENGTKVKLWPSWRCVATQIQSVTITSTSPRLQRDAGGVLVGEIDPRQGKAMLLVQPVGDHLQLPIDGAELQRPDLDRRNLGGDRLRAQHQGTGSRRQCV